MAVVISGVLAVTEPLSEPKDWDPIRIGFACTPAVADRKNASPDRPERMSGRNADLDSFGVRNWLIFI